MFHHLLVDDRYRRSYGHERFRPSSFHPCHASNVPFRIEKLLLHSQVNSVSLPRSITSGRLSRDVLVLVDGRTPTPRCSASTYWEVQNALMEVIDRIEVIHGMGAAI
jgi:hypothetical protein